MVEFEAQIDEEERKYREEPFTDVVQEITVEDIKGKQKIIIKFGEDPWLFIPTPKTMKEGKVPGYHDLAIFLKSVKENGMKPFLDIDPELHDLIGFRTEPSMEDHEVSFNFTTKEGTNSEGKLVQYKKWFVEKTDFSEITTEQPKETKTESNYEELKLELTDILMVLLGIEPKKEVQIMRDLKEQIKDQAHAIELNKIRKQVLSELVAENILAVEDGVYTLV